MRLAWTILPASVAGGTILSNDLLQIIVAIATLVVIVVSVTVAIVELCREVLARRLQGISARFSAVWPEEAH